MSDSIRQKTVLMIIVAERLEVDGKDVDEKILGYKSLEVCPEICNQVQQIVEWAEKQKFRFNISVEKG